MQRSFEDRLAEAWYRLERIRHSTGREPLFKWQRLSKRTSWNGALCGLIVYGRGLFWKKPFAEVILAYGPYDDCYRVWFWRKGYEPREVLPGGDASDRLSLDAAVEKIEEIVGTIRTTADEGKLKTSLPSAWIGRSGTDILKSLVRRIRDRG